jgi:hypothetical protein
MLLTAHSSTLPCHFLSCRPNQTSYYAPYSPTPSAYTLPLMLETTFHTHTKQQEKSLVRKFLEQHRLFALKMDVRCT